MQNVHLQPWQPGCIAFAMSVVVTAGAIAALIAGASNAPFAPIALVAVRYTVVLALPFFLVDILLLRPLLKGRLSAIRVPAVEAPLLCLGWMLMAHSLIYWPNDPAWTFSAGSLPVPLAFYGVYAGLLLCFAWLTQWRQA